MSTFTFTLDEADKQFSADDWKREGLKTGQIYRWRITKLEPTTSKAGKAMVVITVCPTTENGAALKQYSQRVYMVLPVKSLGEKAYRFALQKYFGILQSFCAPKFNAFSKIEKSENGTTYYGKDGEALDRNGREAAINAAKTEMTAARETVLQHLEVGLEAFAPLKAPKEGEQYPEVGGFSQEVNPDSEMPFADSMKDMVG